MSVRRQRCSWIGAASKFIFKRTYCSNELYFDSRVLQPLSIFGPNCNSSFYGLAIHIQGSLLSSVLVELHIHHLPVIRVFEDDVDIDRGREEVRHRGNCKLTLAASQLGVTVDC